MDIVCAGPGPHNPANGILGQSDRLVTGLLCSLDAEAARVAALPAQVAAVAVLVKVAAAESGLVSLNTQLAAWKTQLAADIASVTAGGWDVLTSQQRTAIMLRILNGFGTAMAATVDHAIVTGAIASGV